MPDLSAAASAVASVAGTSARIARTLEPYLRIETQELSIHAPDRTGSLRVFATVKNNWRKPFARVVRFEHPEVHRFTVLSLPIGRPETAAVGRTERGFTLDPSRLSDCDSLLLGFDFRIQNEHFVDALVKVTTKHDVQDEHDDYWITAQLRHPAALRAKHYSIELQDVDFNVDVAVHQDIRDVVPKAFLDNLDTITTWVRESNRSKKMQLSMRHLRQKGVGFAGKEVDITRDALELFHPGTFRKYISVENRFRFIEVRRGMEFYESIPNLTFPRAMTVVSRTDLNLETCASDGVVKYRRASFQQALGEVFPGVRRPTLASASR
jgi:hypothetical protein